MRSVAQSLRARVQGRCGHAASPVVAGPAHRAGEKSAPEFHAADRSNRASLRLCGSEPLHPDLRKGRQRHPRGMAAHAPSLVHFPAKSSVFTAGGWRQHLLCESVRSHSREPKAQPSQDSTGVQKTALEALVCKRSIASVFGGNCGAWSFENRHVASARRRR
jgi:hypothetical protein